jgi:fluoride exporter
VVVRWAPDPAVVAVLGVGFCGALTTYSTFSYEILRLLEDRARFYAAANVGASLLGGFGAVGLGWTLGTWVT